MRNSEEVAAAVDATAAAEQAIAKHRRDAAAATKKLDALKSAQSAASLDFEKIEAAERELRRLALKGELLQRDLEKAKAHQAKVARAGIVAINRVQNLRRHEKVVEFAEALTVTIEKYAAAFEATRSAALVWPDADGSPPPGALLSQRELHDAIAGELYRFTGTPFDGGNSDVTAPAFPGAKCPTGSWQLKGTPSKLPTLIEVSDRATKFAIARLAGELSAPVEEAASA